MQSSPRTAKVLDTEGKQAGEIALPQLFTEPLRLDVIKRAVVAQQSHRFQAQGRNKMAGKRTTAEGFGVGRGISRVPRVGGGGPLSGTAAFAPGTVGGRNAFPPVPWKRTAKRINRKERILALRSAIAATSSKEMVKKRGHRIQDDTNFPLIATDVFEKFSKASEARRFLAALGLWDDIIRVYRSREPHRGRTLHSVGPLLVVKEYQGAEKAFENFQGVQVIRARDLSVEALAPGTHPGRLTVWSESAIKTLAESGGSS